MTGITPETLKTLREVLLTCGPFDSNDALRARFVDARLSPWRSELPEATNRLQRVERTIEFLYQRQNEVGENGILLFLAVVQESLNMKDRCWSEVSEVAGVLEQELAPGRFSSNEGVDISRQPVTHLSYTANPELRIPGYQILDIIAHGPDGYVFRALSEEPQKQIAIKTVDLTRFNETGRSAFTEDAKRLVALNHPGIVPVYDILMRETDAIIVMEYVDCPTLMDKIARMTFQKPGEAILSGARLIGQVAQILSYAHANNVPHRALTPHKIFVDCQSAQSIPRLVGFALGPLPEMVGTPVYQYPDPEPDARSDIFSLGAILLEMLTGRTMANLGLLWILQLQQKEEAAASLRQLNPLIPPGIERICGRCLQTSAARRYQNASELAEDLANESRPRRHPIRRFLRPGSS